MDVAGDKYGLVATWDRVPLFEHRVFYRLQALRDIPEVRVRRGDLGGLVSGPENLSQLGVCWIGYDGSAIEGSRVQESGLVTSGVVRGSAVVSGSATISNNSHVFDQAVVDGDAIVDTCSRIHGRALVSGGEILAGSDIADDVRVRGRPRIASSILRDHVVVAGRAQLDGVELSGDLIFGDAVRMRHVRLDGRDAAVNVSRMPVRSIGFGAPVLGSGSRRGPPIR